MGPQGTLVNPLRDEPLLVLGVGDLEFLDRPPDRFLLISRANMPDIGCRAPLYPDDAPLVKSLWRLTTLLGRLFGHTTSVISSR
jgi:hypothetical protein